MKRASSRCTAKKTKDEALELLTNDLVLLGLYEHMEEERKHLLHVIAEVKVNTWCLFSLFLCIYEQVRNLHLMRRRRRWWTGGWRTCRAGPETWRRRITELGILLADKEMNWLCFINISCWSLLLCYQYLTADNYFRTQEIFAYLKLERQLTKDDSSSINVQEMDFTNLVFSDYCLAEIIHWCEDGIMYHEEKENFYKLRSPDQESPPPPSLLHGHDGAQDQSPPTPLLHSGDEEEDQGISNHVKARTCLCCCSMPPDPWTLSEPHPWVLEWLLRLGCVGSCLSSKL